MSIKNITMKEYNGSGYDELHPKTTPEQIDGVISIQQGGTGATNAMDAREALGLSSLATASLVSVGEGGTGETSRFSNSQIANYDGGMLKSFSYVCRYYPYLRLVYLDINATTKRKIEWGEDINFGFVVEPSFIPAARRALNSYIAGIGITEASISSGGGITVMAKTDLPNNYIISVSGFYRV